MAVRKPGYSPKRRGNGDKKRNAVIFIKAEGKNKTETKYLRKFVNRNVQIHFAQGISTDPVNMVDELISEMKEKGFASDLGDLSFCLIDSDLAAWKNSKIYEADILAKENEITVIVSSPCFEIWFLCHYSYSTRQYGSNDEVIAELQKKMPGYSKNSNDVYERICLETDNAIANARRLERYLLESGRTRHTVGFQPSTEMYSVIEGIRKIEKRNQNK